MISTRALAKFAKKFIIAGPATLQDTLCRVSEKTESQLTACRKMQPFLPLHRHLAHDFPTADGFYARSFHQSPERGSPKDAKAFPRHNLM